MIKDLKSMPYTDDSKSVYECVKEEINKNSNLQFFYFIYKGESVFKFTVESYLKDYFYNNYYNIKKLCILKGKSLMSIFDYNFIFLKLLIIYMTLSQGINNYKTYIHSQYELLNDMIDDYKNFDADKSIDKIRKDELIKKIDNEMESILFSIVEYCANKKYFKYLDNCFGKDLTRFYLDLKAGGQLIGKSKKNGIVFTVEKYYDKYGKEVFVPVPKGRNNNRILSINKYMYKNYGLSLVSASLIKNRIDKGDYLSAIRIANDSLNKLKKIIDFEINKNKILKKAFPPEVRVVKCGKDDCVYCSSDWIEYISNKLASNVSYKDEESKNRHILYLKRYYSMVCKSIYNLD